MKKYNRQELCMLIKPVTEEQWNLIDYILDMQKQLEKDMPKKGTVKTEVVKQIVESCMREAGFDVRE